MIRHPQYRWWVILGSLLYVLSPLDISPDLLPIIGWVDDGLLTTLVVTEISQVLVNHLKSRKGKASGTEEAATVDAETVSVS